MPREFFDPQQKAAILEAARRARAEGKLWMDVVKAAQKAGYTGRPSEIVKLLLNEAGPKQTAATKQPLVATRPPGPPVLNEPRCKLAALQLDEGPAWEFRLAVQPTQTGGEYVVRGILQRGEEQKDLSEPRLLIAGGWVFWPTTVARLNDSDAFPWIALMRQKRELRVPVAHGGELLTQLLRFAHLPPLDLPEALRFEQVAVTPHPRLKVCKPKFGYQRDKVCGELSFDYGGQVVAAGATGRGVFAADERRLHLRNFPAERTAAERLTQLGFRPGRYDVLPELTTSKLPRVVRTPLVENWHVEAEGKLYRRPGEFKLAVASGIDWFELHGSVAFDGEARSIKLLVDRSELPDLE